MPVPSSGAPRLRRRLASLAAVLALAAGGSAVGMAVAPSAYAAPATVTGAACLPGTGVTVLVDFAPASDSARIGCALGEQANIGAAATAAGLTLDAPTGFVTAIDGVAAPATGYWSFWLSTEGGSLPGSPVDAWAAAQYGLESPSLPIDTELGFIVDPDFLDADSPQPRITVDELTGAAGPTPTSTTSTSTTSTSTTTTTETPPTGTSTSTPSTSTPSTSETSDTSSSSASSSATSTSATSTSDTTSESTAPSSTGTPTGPTSTSETGSTTTDTSTPAAGPRDVIVSPASYGPSSGERTLAAAQWLAAQVEADAGLLGGDYGLTADAIIGLSAAGVSPGAIDLASSALAGSGEAYIGAPALSATKAGAIAKTALALEIAGVDPTAFPTPAGDRNLLAELRAALTPTGQFGPNDFPLVHSLAVLALQRTQAGVPAEAVSWLIAAQCADPSSANVGGYGFDAAAPCSAVDADSTAVAVQALAATGTADGPVAAGLTWLVANQQGDGGWTAGFGGSNTNSTGLAVQAVGTVNAAGLRGAEYIAANQVQCASLAAGAFTEADLGAIAYDAAAVADGQEFGIDDATADQWKRATAQAVLGLGVPPLDEITAEGAQDVTDLTCAVPVPVITTTTTTTETTTATTTETETGTGAPVTRTVFGAALGTVAAAPAWVDRTVHPVHPISARPLAETGVSTSTLPLAGVGAGVIVLGGGLLLLGRRGRGRHQS